MKGASPVGGADSPVRGAVSPVRGAVSPVRGAVSPVHEAFSRCAGLARSPSALSVSMVNVCPRTNPLSYKPVDHAVDFGRHIDYSARPRGAGKLAHRDRETALVRAPNPGGQRVGRHRWIA